MATSSGGRARPRHRTAVHAPPSPAVAGGGGGRVTAPGDDAERFWVDVPGFEGPLEQLVDRARRRELDLAPVSVSAITAAYRASVAAATEPDAQELADFLTHASRLVALKAAHLIPDTGLDIEAVEVVTTEASPVDDPGSRLAEYRLFRAAVDGLLADTTGEASRSFLATVGPAAVPAEILTISQERLVGALRGVLARLPETEPATIPAAAVVPVEERCAALRALLAERGAVPFLELFATVTSRLEAVATFLALLELIKRGEVQVEVEGDEGSSVLLLLRLATPIDAGSPPRDRIPTADPSLTTEPDAPGSSSPGPAMARSTTGSREGTMSP